jgi:hypothetical protein
MGLRQTSFATPIGLDMGRHKTVTLIIVTATAQCFCDQHHGGEYQSKKFRDQHAEVVFSSGPA